MPMKRSESLQLAFLPVAQPDLSGDELRFVTEAIESSWISSTGKFVDRFEKEFAAACDATHCLSVTNGTDALHLALLGQGLGPGDEVIVPSLSYIASANAVTYCGATPVFADVSMGSWTIDPDALQAALSPRTKGIMAVHLYGHPADMDALQRFADTHGLWIVEDAAEAHFAKYKGRTVGALAQSGTFSFYGNKILTCGEGGAVVLNDEETHARLAILKGQGMDPAERYSHPVIGHNWRLTNVAAAILCAQLDRADQIQASRQQVYRWYVTHLSDLPGIGLQPREPWADIAPWLFSITVEPGEYGCNATELAKQLGRLGIDTRPFFRPIHRQVPYREVFASRPMSLSNTDKLSSSGLNLPTFSGMLEDDVDRVSTAIREAFTGA